jgi:hypothetical protein
MRVVGNAMNDLPEVAAATGLGLYISCDGHAPRRCLHAHQPELSYRSVPLDTLESLSTCGRPLSYSQASNAESSDYSRATGWPGLRINVCAGLLAGGH